MDSKDLLAFLSKGRSDDELVLLCQAAMDDMGPKGFLEAIRPAADDALGYYEDKLDGLIRAFDLMMEGLPDRVVSIGMLSGAMLDSKFERMDICTLLTLCIDRLRKACEK